MPRALTLGLIGFAVLLLAVVVIGGVAIASFDPESQKPRIIAAVQQATGRDLALNGPIALKPSLWPTLTMENVALANPPGFSRPEIMRLRRAELRLALIPLLSRRVEIDRLVLVDPEIRLETDGQGRANWRFAAVQPAAAPTAPAPPAQPGTPFAVTIREARVQGGTIAYLDGRTNRTTALAVRQIAANATSAEAPLHLTADVAYQGAQVTLAADTGSLARLQDLAARTPWPVAATLWSGGASVKLEGALTRPAEAKGYSLAVHASVPDLSALSALLAGVALPPAHDVTLAAQVADQGATLPAISQLALHIGATDLSAWVAGLRLEALDVLAPSLDAPVTVKGNARLGDAPVTLAATTALPQALLGKPPAPLPLDVTLDVANGQLTAKGSIADPVALTGVALDLAAQIPDLAALSPLARRPLPAVQSIAFSGRLTDQGGLRQGVALHGMRLTVPEGDLAGDVAATMSPRPSVRAVLASQRIDADALLVRLNGAATPQAEAQAAQGGGSGDNDNAPAGPPAAPAPAHAAASAKPAANRLFSDRPIPFDRLRAADADVRLQVAALRFDGADYKSLDGHLKLRDGVLRLDPFGVAMPEGPMASRVTVDAARSPPSVAAWVRAPGLALKPLLAAIGQPPIASGKLEVHADLQAAGATPHEMAASLDGTLGFAMAGGTIDMKLLGGFLGRHASLAGLLGLVGRGGSGNEIRCIALRAQARDGIAQLQPLLLSSALLTMDGGGSVNLRDETLGLTLRPQGRVGGTGFRVPLRVSGPLRAPQVEVDAARSADSNAGALAGIIIGRVPELGPLGGLLGGAVGGTGGGGGDSCGGALALARGSAAPEPAQAAAPAVAPPAATAPSTPGFAPAHPSSRPLPNDPAGLLRQFFR